MCCFPQPIPNQVPVAYAQFTTDFPEFSNTAVYTTAQFNFWANVVVNMTNPCKWGALYVQGQELLIAHYMVQAGLNTVAAGVGAAPGEVFGPTTAEHSDKVGFNTDPALSTLPNSGDLGSTTYGQQYLRIARMIGAGPIQFAPPATNWLTIGVAPYYQAG